MGTGCFSTDAAIGLIFIGLFFGLVIGIFGSFAVLYREPKPERKRLDVRV